MLLLVPEAEIIFNAGGLIVLGRTASWHCIGHPWAELLLAVMHVLLMASFKLLGRIGFPFRPGMHVDSS